MRLDCFTLAFTLLALPVSAIAQERPPPAAGEVLRVHRRSYPNAPVRATLLGTRADTLIVASTKTGDTLHLALDEVTRLDIRTGTKAKWVTGLGLGAAAGLMLGGVVGAIMESAYGPSDMIPYWMAGAVVGVGVGATTGAIIGSTIKKDRWTELDLDRMRIRPMVGSGGSLGLKVSWRF